jgi:hypothetical protein
VQTAPASFQANDHIAGQSTQIGEFGLSDLKDGAGSAALCGRDISMAL